MNGAQAYAKLRRFIAPSLRFSQDIYEAVLRTELAGVDTWLDLGCGHQVLPNWRARAEDELLRNRNLVVGLDYSFTSLQGHRTISNKVQGDIGQLPFGHNTFDLVTANMVVEHLIDPRRQFKEVLRILRPGGTFLFHTPNAHSHFVVMRRMMPQGIRNSLIKTLDGRPEEDAFDVYYRANSVATIRRLAKDSGFTVATIRMVVSDAVFAPIPPLALLELLWIRALMTPPLKNLRTNIIAMLQKATGPTES
jgi:ubiquinone/menaquinone biosynthesis C-methylase UbiE